LNLDIITNKVNNKDIIDFSYFYSYTLNSLKEVPQHEVAAGDANTHEHPVVGPSIPTWSNTEAEFLLCYELSSLRAQRHGLMRLRLLNQPPMWPCNDDQPPMVYICKTISIFFFNLKILCLPINNM